MSLLQSMMMQGGGQGGIVIPIIGSTLASESRETRVWGAGSATIPAIPGTQAGDHIYLFGSSQITGDNQRNAVLSDWGFSLIANPTGAYTESWAARKVLTGAWTGQTVNLDSNKHLGRSWHIAAVAVRNCGGYSWRAEHGSDGLPELGGWASTNSGDLALHHGAKWPGADFMNKPAGTEKLVAEITDDGNNNTLSALTCAKHLSGGGAYYEQPFGGGSSDKWASISLKLYPAS